MRRAMWKEAGRDESVDRPLPFNSVPCFFGSNLLFSQSYPPNSRRILFCSRHHTPVDSRPFPLNSGHLTSCSVQLASFPPLFSSCPIFFDSAPIASLPSLVCSTLFLITSRPFSFRSGHFKTLSAQIPSISRHVISIPISSLFQSVLFRFRARKAHATSGRTSCASRLAAISQYASQISIPMAFRPISFAACSVVPEPMNGSRTVSFFNDVLFNNHVHGLSCFGHG